jgi:hypothetical protein
MAKIPSAIVVLPCALSSMLAILALAFVADCVRLDNAASGIINLADQDLLALELRMAQSLNSSSSLSNGTLAAIKAYDSAKVPTERHTAFLHVVQSFESDDANNQGSRFVDEVRGIANRWSVSMQMYKAEVDKRNHYRQSKRGKIAAWFRT